MRRPHGFPGRHCGRTIGDDPGRNVIKKVGRDLLVADFRLVAPVVVEDFKPHRADGQLLREPLSG